MTTKQITPESVEAFIDRVGRQRVFDRAAYLGWKEGGAPLWVWQQICRELLSDDEHAATAIGNRRA